MSRSRGALLGVAGVATVLLVWHGLVATAVLDPVSVPRPVAVAGRAADLLRDDAFQSGLIDTLRTWVTALGIAAAVAVPLGIAAGSLSRLDRPLSFVVHAARSVPSTALIPVAILFFGLGVRMKVSLVIYATFWPLLLNAIYGARQVDPMMTTVARSLRWGRGRILWRVVLPAAAPSIATGIRVAAGIGLIVVLSAELLGASSGAGVVIVTFQQAERPDFVYAGIVLIGALGLAISASLSFLERWALPWAVANRR